MEQLRHKPVSRRKQGEAKVAITPGRAGGSLPQTAEAALRENEQRLRMALKAANMVTWEWDILAGTIRYSSNVHEVARGDDTEPYNSVRSLIQTVHPDDRAALVRAIRRTTGKGLPYECEYRVKMLDGTYRWIAGRGDVVERRDGKPARALGVSQDIDVRKRAEQALQERSRQLADLATQITLIEHRERRRLADYLHEHLQQLLVGARMQLHALATEGAPLCRGDLNRLGEILTEAVEAARSMSQDIAPPIAVHRHLPDAFQWLMHDVQQRYGLGVRARIRGSLANVPETESILLFAAARELLLNVVKHAGVRDARLELARHRDAVVLTVSDRGCGFDTSRLTSHESRGFGLFSIRERVESLGGSFMLESRPGRGVLVAVGVPFRSASRMGRKGSRGQRQPARAAIA